MIKIMFICHGNICRSPMAEFIMKDIVRKAGLSDSFEIASCATSTEEIGNPVYPPARAELKKHGITCDGKRAVQLKKSDYARYDYLVCMDSYNRRNMMYILDCDPERKISRLMDHTDRPGDVFDPWFTNDFKTAYTDIYDGCTALFNKLKDHAE